MNTKEVNIMPWKETDKMEQKEQFIHEMLKGEKPFKHLCQDFGIAEKTGHKMEKQILRSKQSSGFIGRYQLKKMSCFSRHLFKVFYTFSLRPL
jgi:hypothetical protein